VSINTTLEALGRDIISWAVPLLDAACPHTVDDIISGQRTKCVESPEAYKTQTESVINYAKAAIGVAVLTTFFLATTVKALFVATVGGLAVIGIRDFSQLIQNPDVAVDSVLGSPEQPDLDASSMSIRSSVTPYAANGFNYLRTPVSTERRTGFTPRFVNFTSSRGGD